MLKAWGVLFYSAAASFLCWLAWLGLESYSYEQQQQAVLPILFIFCFAMGYLEFQSTGKKLGLSLFALNLLVLPAEKSVNPTRVCWYWFEDVLLGIACALLSSFVPWPQLASTRFESRARFGADTIACLFEAIVVAWQQQEYIIPDDYSHDGAEDGGEDQVEITEETAPLPLANDEEGAELMQEEGRDVRRRSTTINGFDREAWRRESWNLDESNHDVALMDEEVIHLTDTTEPPRLPIYVKEKTTPTMSRWRVLRATWQAVLCFRDRSWGKIYNWHGNAKGSSKSMRLELCEYVMSRLDLLSQRSNEARFGPNRGRAVDRYNDFIVLLRELIVIITSMESRLAAMENLLKKAHARKILLGFHSDPEFRRTLRGVSSKLVQCFITISRWLAENSNDVDENLMNCAFELHAAQRQFDQAYLKARIDVYYVQKTAYIPELLLAFNSFVFLHELAATLVGKFCLSRENVAASELLKEADENKGFIDPISSSKSVLSFPISLFARLIQSLSSLSKDLFPSQRSYFTFVLRDDGTRGISVENWSRLLSVFAMASAMTLGGVYGVLANRPQPFLASFTVAYLSGGSVSGVNVVTSINRAVGTVVASVFVIIILLIVEPWNDSLSSNLFIGFACALFVLPSTYIRR